MVRVWALSGSVGVGGGADSPPLWAREWAGKGLNLNAQVRVRDGVQGKASTAGGGARLWGTERVQ